jgi:hypothetical protein
VRTTLASSVRGALSVLFAAGLVPLAAPGCSVGDGSGAASGVLDVPDCWSGNFDLNPTFFAADPYADTLTIRVQNSGDYASFSDGISILVDNVHEVRGDAPYSPSLLGKPLNVALPAGATIAGAPVIAQADPAIVHATVYLQKSCPTQNVALSALEAVSVDAAGDCNPATTGPYILACNAPAGAGLGAVAAFDASVPDGGGAVDATLPDAGAPPGSSRTVLPAGAPVRHSTITFQSLFDGNPAESSAAQRLSQATFDLYLADPRDACPGGLGQPPPCRGHLTGSFQFYFQRGRPGQPFP